MYKYSNRVIAEAKIKFESERIKKNKNNPKHLWEIIKSKLGKSGKKDHTIKQVYNDDSQTFKYEFHSYLDVKHISMNFKSIFLIPTDSLEVQNIINRMEVQSGEVDNINVKTFKLLYKFLSSSSLINRHKRLYFNKFVISYFYYFFVTKMVKTKLLSSIDWRKTNDAYEISSIAIPIKICNRKITLILLGVWWLSNFIVADMYFFYFECGLK